MKKSVFKLLVLALILGLIAACSGGGSPSSPASGNGGSTGGEVAGGSDSGAGEQVSQEEPPQDEPVTIRFSFPASSDAEKQWVEDFEQFVAEQYPNVTIEWLHIPGGELLTKLAIMISAGDIPDLIAAQDIRDFVLMGALEPLSGYVENDEDIDLSHFNQAALEASIVDGELYTLPTLAIGYALLANTEVLAEAGYRVEDIQTWDDYLEVAEAITKNDTYAHAFAGSVPRFAFRDFYIVAASNGVMYDRLTDPDLKQNLIEVFEFYKRLKPYLIPDAVNADWGNIHRSIVDGKVGFLGSGTYFSGYLSSFDEYSLEYLRPLPFPKGPSADKSQALIGNLGFGIFSASENKEWAWRLLKDALSEDFSAKLAGSINVTALQTIPEEKMKSEVEKFYAATIDAQMEILEDWQAIMNEHGVPQPQISGQAEIERIYSEKIAQLLLTDMSPEDVYEEFIAEVKKVEEEG